MEHHAGAAQASARATSLLQSDITNIENTLLELKKEIATALQQARPCPLLGTCLTPSKLTEANSQYADVTHVAALGKRLELLEKRVEILKRRMSGKRRQGMVAAQLKSNSGSLNVEAIKEMEIAAQENAASLLREIEQEAAVKQAKQAKRKTKTAKLKVKLDAPHELKLPDGRDVEHSAVVRSPVSHWPASPSSTASSSSTGKMDEATLSASPTKPPCRQLFAVESTLGEALPSTRSAKLPSTSCWEIQSVGAIHPRSQKDRSNKKASFDVDQGALRREWEDILNTASTCKDREQQTLMAAMLESLMPRVAAAGISVKYGRKILHRLHVVKEARSALQVAIATVPPSPALLEQAILDCRSVRCLLEERLLLEAEDLLASVHTSTHVQNRTLLHCSYAISQPAFPDLMAGVDNKVELRARSPDLGSWWQELSKEYNSSQVGLATPDRGSFAYTLTVDCAVCMSDARNVMCLPCGHVCMCTACAEGVMGLTGQCPVCREAIQRLASP